LATGSVWIIWRRENNLTPTGFEPRTAQPVACRYTETNFRPTYTNYRQPSRIYKGTPRIASKVVVSDYFSRAILKSIQVDDGEQVADSEGRFGVDKWKHLLDTSTGYTRGKSK
jgi:hypothetical protein